MSAAAESVLARVKALLGADALETHAQHGDATVMVRLERARECLAKLRDDAELDFNFLMDVTAVDYLGRAPRFELVYHLASVETQPRAGEPSALRARLRVKTRVPETPCEADSVVALWSSANWMEREVWDLYGIRFREHPDLRRILLYDEFKGHPLRKDYPKERRQPLVGPRN
jgi:NADH-quinone oxidoreductase subunit C